MYELGVIVVQGLAVEAISSLCKSADMTDHIILDDCAYIKNLDLYRD